MKKFDLMLTNARNDMNSTINTIVDEATADFNTYEEAVKAVKEFGWKMSDPVGFFMIDEATKRLKSRALKKTTD